MTQAERQLRQEIYNLKRQNREITKQAAEYQTRIAEIEAAMGRIFKETVGYAR